MGDNILFILPIVICLHLASSNLEASKSSRFNLLSSTFSNVDVLYVYIKIFIKRLRNVWSYVFTWYSSESITFLWTIDDQRYKTFKSTESFYLLRAPWSLFIFSKILLNKILYCSGFYWLLELFLMCFLTQHWELLLCVFLYLPVSYLICGFIYICACFLLLIYDKIHLITY